MRTLDSTDKARSQQGRSRIPLTVLAGAALLVTACRIAPPAEPLPAWNASDETNAAPIEHGAWQAILTAYVAPGPAGVALVDYAALKAHAGDRAALDGYLDRLQSLDPRTYPRAEQQAYWINLYNALTVQLVLDAYPVDTILDIHDGVIPRTGPWDDPAATIAGLDLTLNDIEHRILRPFWRDARIHYAVNCAALSCPDLQGAAFTADNTNALLDAGAHAYVNHPRGVQATADNTLVLSSIYDWYVVDFGGGVPGVLDHLRRYAAPPLAARLAAFDGAISYTYDWDLNDVRRPDARR